MLAYVGLTSMTLGQRHDGYCTSVHVTYRNVGNLLDIELEFCTELQVLSLQLNNHRQAPFVDGACW